ncbi:HEAT repeat domain-containing protein [Exiguobacterium sp. s138]|uniref:HEAT repeat domain-containing protein n=1 Tax=Exiguobacterium sp. s138 TaxID=2751202 RepID=UPI001BE60C26|nr:HEAT repeat domain-containing protein [Exiguobacterium sp. s138]
MNKDELIALAEQMSIDEYVYDEERGYSTSEGSPSDLAYETARRFQDVQMVPVLMDLLEQTKRLEMKQYFYFMLGTIGTNTGDVLVADLLLKRLAQETKPTLIKSILDELANQERVDDATDIIQYVEDFRSAIRNSAIDALGSCRGALAEEALIRFITTSTDSFEIMSANFVLATIGTKRVIPHLLPLLHHPKGDVRHSALNAISELGDDTFLPVFIKGLEDRSIDVKTYALLGIVKHGDASAIQPVIKRLKIMLKRKRQIQSDEGLVALRFLNRYRQSDKTIPVLFDWIVAKKWNVLFDDEQDWLNEHLEGNR